MRTFRVWTKEGKGPVNIKAESYSTEYGVLTFRGNLGKCVIAFAPDEWRFVEEIE